MLKLIKKLVQSALSLPFLAMSALAEDTITHNMDPVPAANFDDIPTPQEFFQTENGQRFLQGFLVSGNAFIASLEDSQNLYLFPNNVSGLILNLEDAKLIENPAIVTGVINDIRNTPCQDYGHDEGTNTRLCAAQTMTDWSVWYAGQFSTYITNNTVQETYESPYELWAAIAASPAQGALLRCEIAGNQIQGRVSETATEAFNELLNVADVCLSSVYTASAVMNYKFYPTIGNTLANGVNCLRGGPCVTAPN